MDGTGKAVKVLGPPKQRALLNWGCPSNLWSGELVVLSPCLATAGQRSDTVWSKLRFGFFVLLRPVTDAELHVPNKIVSGLSSDQNINLNHYEIVD